MKNTRRLIAAATTLAMVSALAPMAVFAEDQGMTVAYTYTPPAPTYTVTIPSGVTLSDSDAVEKNITAESVANMEANGKKVVVTLDAATNDNDTDTTFHAKNGESDATYTITAGETAVKVGDTVAEFTADGTSALTFSEITLPASPVAGDYTETLTFGIALADTAPAPKQLTLSGQRFNFEAGGYEQVSFTIEYTDNDTWQDMVDKYDEIYTWDYDNAPDGKVINVVGNDGCQLKHPDSTGNYNLVSINSKITDLDVTKYYLSS